MIYPNRILKTSRRTLSISITSQGEVVLRVPKYISNEKAMEFYKSKQSWVEKKLNENTQNIDRLKDIIEYKSALFLGKIFPIVTINSSENKISISDEKLIIFTKAKSPNIKKILKEFYIDVINNILLPRIHKYSEILNVDFTTIKYINSKCKWGMCDNKSIIYFNYKLIMLPIEIVDYVIVHELTHLKELNHSKDFWDIIKKIMPKYKTYYNDIKKYGVVLKLF